MPPIFRLLVLGLILVTPFFGESQTDEPRILQLTLPQVIELAQSDAPDVLIARTSLTRSYWRFQTILADYKPQIVFLGPELPNFDRSIRPIPLPNGRISFVPRSLMQNTLFLGVEQRVSLTGASVSVGSSLSRIDDFVTGDVEYLSSPLSINISQPLFQFNEQKAQLELEPKIYEESKRQYSEDMEQVAFQAANLFFEVLNAQLNVEAAQRDLSDADTLYTISKGRFDVGKIAETDLLQIELNVRNADAALAAATLSLQSATEQLRDFLGIQEAIQFQMIPPAEIPDFSIDVEKALESALNYRSQIVSLEIDKLDAEQDVERARMTGFEVGISGFFGLSQTDNSLSKAYQELLDQQRLNINFRLPIVDWGKRRSDRERANANLEVVNMSVQQDRISFEREIIVKVQQFDLQRDQVALAERAYEVAQRRNYITRQRYLIGKIGITDLNLALSEQENARQGYVQALQRFWIAYYELRRLTLYDWANNEPLIQEVEEGD